MAWYPHATKRELPYAKRMPLRQQSPTVVLHTNAGGAGPHGDLYDWFARAGNDVCSHFQIGWDGRVFQYVDTAREAYAQYDGNRFAVSIETQDDGHPEKPWTAAQVNAVVALCQWLKVPARRSPDGPGGGVGWHEQYPAWNRSGHHCPGAVRERQITQTIIPRLGDDMPTAEDLLNAHIGLVDDDPHHVDHTVKSLLLSLAHEVFAIRAQTQQILTNKKDD